MKQQDDIHDLNILICDDSITNVMILSKLLESEGFTSIKTLTDPVQVFPTLESGEFDLLLLDIEMPHMSGFDVMRDIATSDLAAQLIPILVLTGCQGHDVRNQALQSGAQDFLNKPFDQTEVVLRVENILRVRMAYLAQRNLTKKLEYLVSERTKELGRATDILIERLAGAAELRDKNAGKHVWRVGKYARVLADAYGLSREVSFLIEKAAPLHDVGKIGLTDNVLLKAESLTPEERKTMESHTILGAKLLSDHDSALVRMASSIALSHHERWDGTGYPFHLKGASIPIEGRITAIVDTFDVLTTKHAYKQPLSIEDAVRFIADNAGSQFDPDLAKLFVKHIDTIRSVRASYPD